MLSVLIWRGKQCAPSFSSQVILMKAATCQTSVQRIGRTPEINPNSHAHSVSSITASSFDPSTRSIKLTSNPIEWTDAGSRMSLELRHVKPDVYERQLVRRQKPKDTEEEQDGFLKERTFNLAAGNATDRKQIWPLQTSPSDLKPRYITRSKTIN